jgi:hypothetical protein
MSGLQDPNKSSRLGIDFTLSLVPMGVPVWLENQYMSNNETNPTGFGREFKWKGGFDQINWQISKTAIAYARYDYLKGDTFNDTTVTMGAFTGITASTPKEHDFILGAQYLIEQNVKLVGEFRSHKFEDTITPTAAKLSDNGFTLRIMLGF